MPEKNQTNVLAELKTALADVPEEYHGPIAQMLTHDISVIARTIGIIIGQGAA